MRSRSAKVLAEAVDAVVAEGVGIPERSWNVAPTDPVLIVVEREVDGVPRRELHTARWGLIPPWAKDANGGAKTINARIETVAEKPTYADAVRARRCLVAADGYYEWQRLADRKQPFYVYPANDEPMYFAGLYSWWADPAFEHGDPARWVLTASILTCPAVGRWADIHDRMPVALIREAREAWLRAAPPEAIPELLDEARAAAQESAHGWAGRPVSQAVGSVRNNRPELIEAVSSSPEPPPHDG